MLCCDNAEILYSVLISWCSMMGSLLGWSKMVYKPQKRPVEHYDAIHKWVNRNFGKANKCENCHKSGLKMYDWANVSGEYNRDIADWKQLCRSCHSNFDNKGEATRAANSIDWENRKFCIKGHSLAEAGYYTHANGGRTTKRCKICVREAVRMSQRKRYAINNG